MLPSPWAPVNDFFLSVTEGTTPRVEQDVDARRQSIGPRHPCTIARACGAVSSYGAAEAPYALISPRAGSTIWPDAGSANKTVRSFGALVRVSRGGFCYFLGGRAKKFSSISC